MSADLDLDLDRIDIQLLEELQRDAKLSLKGIGERVGLSAPAVMERVRKLEQAGVIRGYHAQIDARRAGVDVAAFIGVTISTPAKLRDFERYVDAVPAILECHHVTGAHTLLLKTRVPNTGALEQLISGIRSFEGVTGTETMVVLSTYSERIPVPLDSPKAAGKKRRSRKSG